jgi:hypothetical protein
MTPNDLGLPPVDLYLISEKSTFFFGFQGHHFIIATLPNPPYISEMIPAGFTADGSIEYTMTGLMPEVFDNLQVSACQSTNRQNQ